MAEAPTSDKDDVVQERLPEDWIAGECFVVVEPRPGNIVHAQPAPVEQADDDHPNDGQCQEHGVERQSAATRRDTAR